MVRLRKNKAADVAVQQEPEVAGAVQQDVAVQQEQPVTTEVQGPPEAPATTEPAKVKVARYAPASSLNNMAAVITVVVPQAKGPSGKSKSSTRYNTFYQPGITVGQFIASYKAANLSTTLARADLRWDLRSGFITIE